MRIVAFAAALSAALPAFPAGTPTAWRTEKNKFFTCEIPVGWRSEPLMDREPGFFMTDGVRSIRAVRYGSDNHVYKDKEDLIEQRRRERGEYLKVSSAVVMGVESELLGSCYQRTATGDDAPTFPEWIYEETVLVPVAGGFWELDFMKTSAVPGSLPPEEMNIWERFLRTFKPAKKK